ncbi:Crp/Fnr family transcriptional regulator [Chryseobacterium sp. ISL-6]|uniref:Crp/Fnr family transcriptional regulator n=1 Tax=Chryseobacterium sp. ISL-6 TaxID=2819143 RepID=UPI001BE94F42|nr:Crp/Fnr family transcriptional regulator [Chryseobacterium sp. ISL-6]MBT2620117.1 Crp/Fnr family transcriptional regulator [Chryseobacterium sp. ISL-6]
MLIKEDMLIKFGAKKVKYKKNEVLFTENTIPLYYFQIKNGSVKLINHHKEGREFIHNLLSKGDSIGETFLFSEYPYLVNAMVVEDSIVFELERTAFHKLLKTHPDILFQLYQYTAEKMRYRYKMNNLIFNNPTGRILTVLNDLKEQQQQQQQQQYSCEVPYTRQQIASLTGLRVETVVRNVKHLEKEGILKIIKGKIFY